MVPNSSFCHNLSCTFNQQNSFTKVIKLGVLKKKSRKRGYGPPAFVCLSCNINFMQKEDIFWILLLWYFYFNTVILQFLCKLSKVWDILDWVKLLSYLTFYYKHVHTCILAYFYTCILAFTCILSYLYTCILGHKIYNFKFDQNQLRIEWDISS